MTRVLHVFTSAKFVPFVLPLLTGLKANGYEVLAASSDGIDLRHLEALGIEVHRLFMTRRVTPLRDLKSVWELTRLLATLKPDVVHAHNPKAGLLTMLAASFVGISPRIYHVHGSPFLTAEGRRLRLFWLTESVSHFLSSAPIAVSRSLIDALAEAGVWNATSAEVLGRGSAAGIDTSRYQSSAGRERGSQLRRFHGLDERSLVLGFAGRYIREKGLSELHAAWIQILKRFPSAHLLLAGAPDGDEAALVEELRQASNVIDLGFLEDMAPFFEAIDVFALPSYREGLSTVLLEALAFEVPVVASRTVGTVDVVVPGENGFLVPPKDAPALSRAVLELFGDAALRAELGRNGRELVVRSFGRAQMLKALVAFYTELGFPPGPD